MSAFLSLPDSFDISYHSWQSAVNIYLPTEMKRRKVTRNRVFILWVLEDVVNFLFFWHGFKVEFFKKMFNGKNPWNRFLTNKRSCHDLLPIIAITRGLACIVPTEVNHNTDHWTCIRELTEDLPTTKRLNRSSTVSRGQQLETLEVTNSVLKKNISTQR